MPTPTSSSPPSAGSPTASPGTVRIEVARSPIRLPSGRSRAVALVLGPKLLLCGGLTSAGTTGSILQIDVQSGRVSSLGTLSAAVHDAGGAVLDSRGYVIGGGQAVAGATIQRIASVGSATTVGQLPTARADLAAVSVAGEIVVVGGGTPARPDDRVLATTDGRHVRSLGRLLVAVRYPAVAVLGGLVYVIGGSTLSGDTRVIQAVDPASGVVRIVGYLPHPLSHASGLVIGDTVLIAGGRSAGRAQDQLLEFSVASGAVKAVGRLPYPVSDMAAVVVDGVGYLIGGETIGLIATVITVSVD